MGFVPTALELLSGTRRIHDSGHESELEPIPRAKALAEFAKRNSLEREAVAWAKIAAALEQS